MKRLIALVLILSVAFGTSAFAAGTMAEGANVFSDVSSGKWYFTYIDSLTKQGLIKGTGDGRFLPDADMTKAQFVTILVNAVIGPQEQDGSHWAEKSVQAAYEAGITTPSEMPEELWDEPILRQEVARLLSRVCEKSQEKPEITSEMLDEIADYEETPDEYKPYIADVFARGIYTGNEKREMMPEKPVTRAECAAIIIKLLDTSARRPWVRDEFVFDPAVHVYPAGDPLNWGVLKPDAVRYYSDLCVDSIRFYEDNGNLMFEGELPELPDGYSWYFEFTLNSPQWISLQEYQFSFLEPSQYTPSTNEWKHLLLPESGSFEFQLSNESFLTGKFEEGYFIDLGVFITPSSKHQFFQNTANYDLYFGKRYAEGNSPYFSMSLKFSVRDNHTNYTPNLQTRDTIGQNDYVVELAYDYKKVWDFPEVWKQHP